MSASDIPLSGWLDTALRLQRIGVVLARHGFGEIVARIGVAVPLRPGASSAISTHERLARRLADVLTDLGPTYIKLGQLLATRADLLPAEVARTLSSLHASVRPMPFRQVARTLEAELGRPYDRAFGRVDATCLAAASIAQVHRAVLPDGREVVVKVQRPDLRAQVDADLAIMRLVARLLEQHVPELSSYAPVSMVEAFASSITAELDFRNEAENARTLRQLLNGAPEVHVPSIHEAWTSERLLVMDYVPGTPLGDLDPAPRAAARRALLRAFVRQTLEHGVFHADPHPGNMLVLHDGRVALLDHGTVAVLTQPLRGRLLRLCLALLLGRRRALSEHVIALSNAADTGAIDRQQLARDISSVLRASSQGGAGVVAQLLALSRTHGLRLPAALLSFMRALALLDGVLRALDPAADVVRDLRRELAWSSLRLARRAVRVRAALAVSIGARAVTSLRAAAMQVAIGGVDHLARRGAVHARRLLRTASQGTELTLRWARGALMTLLSRHL